MKTTTITSTLKSLGLAIALLGSVSLYADGAALYKKCASCHGMNAEKVALGKSKVIADMTEQELIDAMNGYGDDTYGGAMKGLMKGQVGRLSADDINSLAAYIVSLKK
ncbi:MAG: c-type cytochrome [Sulfurimonas sp.]|nr:c-type cytochrome [Sulfurimonas sp.]